MSLTTVEASKLLQDAVVEMFKANNPFAQYMPFQNILGNSYSYSTEDTLPGVGFRGVNEAYTESTGVINPATETLVIVGGDIDVDKFLIQTEGPQVRSAQEMMKAKAISLALLRKYIKGDQTSDPREIDGLQTRLTGNQLIEAGSTDGGDALSLAKLDELIDTVDGCNALLMNKAMIRRLTSASRLATVGGHIDFTNQFGRRVTTYNEIPILPIEYDNTGTQILGFTEVGSGGSTATATSIYGVNFNIGMVQGIQNGPMTVTDLKETDDAPVFRTRVEWYTGMMLKHGRAAARLRGISNAAVVV
jgi:hypothetical protein